MFLTTFSIGFSIYFSYNFYFLIMLYHNINIFLQFECLVRYRIFLILDGHFGLILLQYIMLLVVLGYIFFGTYIFYRI
jgi:hypothetical protein